VDGADDFVKINAGQIALLRVGHGPDLLARLAPAVSAGKLSSVDVSSLLLDGFALLKAGNNTFANVVATLKSIDPVAADSTVWSAISGVLTALQIILEVSDSMTNTTNTNTIITTYSCMRSEAMLSRTSTRLQRHSLLRDCSPLAGTRKLLQLHSLSSVITTLCLL